MEIIKSWEVGARRVEAILAASPVLVDPAAETTVREILDDVRAHGDEAVLRYTRKFDSPAVTALEVSREEIEAARAQVLGVVLDAIATAAENIRAFHAKQVPVTWLDTSDPGVMLGQKVTALDRVGIHAPGFSAPLPSTVLMCAIPAKVAGVGEVILCSPPTRSGKIHPATLVAADAAGVDRVFRIGGAQAVGAMAYGTESVPRVDKIVGPGNRYVVIAKRMVYGTVDIESLPGPSEVLVLADETGNPRHIAADMLSQAEHGPDSRAVLVTTSEALAIKVNEELDRQLPLLKRSDLARKSLEASAIVVVRDLAEGIGCANFFAPEHLELLVSEPLAALAKIKHAGAILVGDYSSEPIGDYIAGPSHVLPTSGTARFSSALNVEDFVKRSSIIHYTRERFEQVAEKVIALAEVEGLDAHANAIRVRLEGEEV